MPTLHPSFSPSWTASAGHQAPDGQPNSDAGARLRGAARRVHPVRAYLQFDSLQERRCALLRAPFWRLASSSGEVNALFDDLVVTLRKVERNRPI